MSLDQLFREVRPMFSLMYFPYNVEATPEPSFISKCPESLRSGRLTRTAPQRVSPVWGYLLQRPFKLV